MFKSTVRNLLTLAAAFLLGSFLLAQNIQAQNGSGEITQEQWEKLFSSANESAVLDNGKISFLKLAIPNEGEKQFSFTHSEDGKSFTLIDETGLRLGVFLYDDKRIQSVIMPNGEKIVFNWKQVSTGNWIVESLKCGDSLANNPCRDAAVAAAVALGICTLSPGSVACWGATVNAAYLAYKCYEATHLSISPNNTKNLRNYARRFEFGRKTSNKKRMTRDFGLQNS